jgi:hypothetical protein
VQVIANLSVDADCASILSRSNAIVHSLSGCTFTSSDRFGFNLLCAISNFTFHDHTWAPADLLSAIPIAIVSKHIPSIIEALRILCNIALTPNTILIRSQIPEMLGILLKHIHPDVVLYSLQTLANLIGHRTIRRRFRAGGFVTAVLDLFAAEEMDELHLEAIAALLINFGDISADEAALFAAAIDEFEIDEASPVVNVFIEFLNNTACSDENRYSQ